MWPARTRDEPEVLSLFEVSGRNVEAAAHLLRELLVAYPDRPELAAELVALEHEGDRVAREIFAVAAAGGGCLDPADVHALAGALDDIVDHAEEAADRLGLYRVEAPMEQAQELAEVLVAATAEVSAGLSALRAGADLAPRLAEIHRLEDEADRVVRSAVASLFIGGIDPMIVIRWKDIFETLEAAVDACETVANVLEGVALKRAHRR